MIVTGERQVAPTLDGIRRDHVARYRWAATQLGGALRLVDVACGVGYGTRILAEAGHYVVGIDRDDDAIRYGRKFHAHPLARLMVGDAAALSLEPDTGDAAVCFETIEHVEDPRPLLRALRAHAPLLLASVPNERVIPYGDGVAYHFRHYTREEFAELLAECGWEAVEWWGQADDESEVERDIDGRTLIAVAKRQGESNMTYEAPRVELRPAAEQPAAAAAAEPEKPAHESLDWPVPDHVAILGLGPSLEQYVDVAKRLGGKHAFCDEVWGINAVAGVLMCDRVFHMDDVRIQEIRAKAAPQSNIARMLDWLKVHPGPIITSRGHPDYPGLVEFPLERLLREFPHAYLNSTAAYAVAYAILIGVKRISLFGCDYTYPNAHDAEKGRACVEFWIGIGMARGVQIAVANRSTLLDAIHPPTDRLYGYDTLDVTIRADEDGRARVDFVERDALPTAEEIEARYDHSQHPNPLAR